MNGRLIVTTAIAILIGTSVGTYTYKKIKNMDSRKEVDSNNTDENSNK